MALSLCCVYEILKHFQEHLLWNISWDNKCRKVVGESERYHTNLSYLLSINVGSEVRQWVNIRCSIEDAVWGAYIPYLRAWLESGLTSLPDSC